MTTNNLKKEIEAILQITKWSPTESHLIEISRKIKARGRNLTKNELGKIIHSIVGSFECGAMEGLDNSDLTTLLMMATKVENK